MSRADTDRPAPMTDLAAADTVLAVRGSAPRLTAKQWARVRELRIDEGQTLAQAVAWILAFEPAVGKPEVES